MEPFAVVNVCLFQFIIDSGFIWYQVFGTKYLVSSTWYQVLGTKCLVPSTWYISTEVGGAGNRLLNVLLGQAVMFTQFVYLYDQFKGKVKPQKYKVFNNLKLGLYIYIYT